MRPRSIGINAWRSFRRAARELGGSGALIIDQYDIRRGTNFLNLGTPHNVWQSAYQGESALCGSCHSVYAPHLAPDSITGEYTLGRPDLANGENPFYLQSTYPEWLELAIRGARPAVSGLPHAA